VTEVVNGQTILVGSGGLQIASVTLVEAAVSSAVLTIGGVTVSALGSTAAIIGGQTFTYGLGSTPSTQVVNGQTVSIGPDGIGLASSTIGGTLSPSATQVATVGAVTVTEIGSSLAVIDGTTFAIGAGSSPMTEVINGQTISIGPSGLGIAGTTTMSDNPSGTQIITAGGITFSEIGSSLVNIGGTTYTVGPGARSTTETYNGQTISIGPNGIGFSTTTVVPTSTTSIWPPSTTSKKSGVGKAESLGVFIGGCIAISIGMLL